MLSYINDEPCCTFCGAPVEKGPLCILVPGADPLCWECVARLDATVVGYPRGPVILYRANGEGKTESRDSAFDAAEGPRRHRLSAREREVVQLVSRGLTNAEIALRLERSSSTIAKHVSHALSKMQARNRTELVAALSPVPVLRSLE